MALNAAHSSKSDRQLAPREAFGKLPNLVIRNPAVSTGDLVMIAYRCTFGDDERGYGLNPAVLKGIIRSGFGRDCVERGIKNVVKLGLLERSQPFPDRRDGKFYARFATDT